MKYNGRPLDSLRNSVLIRLVKALAGELRMIGSTDPADLYIDDVADLLPSEDEDWNPPRISAILYKGKGKSGGK